MTMLTWTWTDQRFPGWFTHIIPCISAGAARDSLDVFPSLLGLDSYDMQSKINSPDVDQHTCTLYEIENFRFGQCCQSTNQFLSTML